jgi:hypothetical protein
MAAHVEVCCLRIALGWMQSTHVQTLEVIGVVPSLRLRFSMLNHKYLISAQSAQFMITRLRRY